MFEVSEREFWKIYFAFDRVQFYILTLVIMPHHCFKMLTVKNWLVPCWKLELV